jgi:hypothetical protein
MHFYKGLCTGGGGFIVTWLSGFPFGMQRPWHHIPISIWWSARYHTELHGLMMVDCVDLSVLLASQQDWFVKGGGPQRMLNIRGANGCLGLQQIYAGWCCGGIAYMQVRKDFFLYMRAWSIRILMVVIIMICTIGVIVIVRYSGC